MSSGGTAPRELASGKLLVEEPAPGVMLITISNEAKRGALDHEILDGLRDTVRAADARCLVLTGTGKMFSAGYDIGNFDEASFERDAEALVAHPFTEAIEAIEDYRYPVVCAVNGHAIGGGLELALSCDIRICSREARLGMPPAKIGLIYSHTGLRKFIEVCGVANTSELFHVGRNVEAERGLAMGLVNEVVDGTLVVETALALAGEIAANAPLSLAGNKATIRALRAFGQRLPEAVERELVELRESCFRSDDFREGVRSFAERRPPQWRGS
ncbi:MAG: enoyl-CoA hydratase/isomerase family protein [Thermoleophilaceae bacterium]